MVVGPTEPECLDERKQAKFVDRLKTIRPLVIFAPGIIDDKVVMETRDGSDVPGVTGQGACKKTAYVVGKIGDDYFDDLQWESGSRGRACCRGFKRSVPVIYTVEPRYGSIPKSLGKQLNHCSGGS